jgi:hypothetical protein
MGLSISAQTASGELLHGPYLGSALGFLAFRCFDRAAAHFDADSTCDSHMPVTSEEWHTAAQRMERELQQLREREAACPAGDYRQQSEIRLIGGVVEEQLEFIKHCQKRQAVAVFIG